MKVILILLLLVGVGWGVMYYKGGVRTFDPDDQCKKVTAALTIGTPFAKAMEIAGEPVKYRIINKKKKKIAGDEIEYLEPSAEVKFVRQRVEDRLKNNDLPNGFNATYVFSARSAITVNFDHLGNVTGVDKAMTQADLFQMNED